MLEVKHYIIEKGEIESVGREMHILKASWKGTLCGMLGSGWQWVHMTSPLSLPPLHTNTEREREEVVVQRRHKLGFLSISLLCHYMKWKLANVPFTRRTFFPDCFLHSSISLSSFPLGMCAGYSLCLSPFQFYILLLTSSRFCSPFGTAFDEISNNKIKK